MMNGTFPWYKQYVLIRPNFEYQIFNELHRFIDMSFLFQERDPFKEDPEEEVLVGSVNIFLQPISYMVCASFKKCVNVCCCFFFEPVGIHIIHIKSLMSRRD